MTQVNKSIYKTKYKILRARVPVDVCKKFSIICLQMDLSIPKQLTKMIESFVEVQEFNRKLMSETLSQPDNK